MHVDCLLLFSVLRVDLLQSSFKFVSVLRVHVRVSNLLNKRRRRGGWGYQYPHDGQPKVAR
jgi:hypothetical protein